MVDVLEGYARKLFISEAEQQELDNHNKKNLRSARINDFWQFQPSDAIYEQAEADFRAGQAKVAGGCL